jgi:hypothetical protein
MPRVVTRFVRASCERWGHMGEFELRRVRSSRTKRAAENPRANCAAFGTYGVGAVQKWEDNAVFCSELQADGGGKEKLIY